MSRQIVVLLPTESLNLVFEQMLQKGGIPNINVTRITEFESLSEQLRSIQPELILTSPVIVSDPMIPLLKENAELTKTKFIAFCTSHLESSTINHYDAKMTITDSAAEVEDIITSTLALDPDQDNSQVLTPRERDVVIAVVKGLTNKEIADELFLSTHTVITHRRNIAKKLNIHSPSGLTIYAIMNKLVELNDIMK